MEFEKDTLDPYIIIGGENIQLRIKKERPTAIKVIKTPGMRARKNSTSYNTKRNTVVARNPIQMDQRVQGGK